jgi:diacylglycerol kinase family enzyme
LLDPHAPLFIVLNAASGACDVNDARSAISAELDAGRRPHEFLVAERGADVEGLSLQAARRAAAEGGAVVAAGGDGTINAAARATLPTGRPLGIIPQGTFNYTTRAHGIPADTREAARALLNPRILRIQVGLVNERPFLVNAGVGLHPEILEDREAYKARFGRYRAVALGAGLSTLLGASHQLVLEIEHDRERELVRTPSLFVGNNALQFEQTGLEQAEDDVEHRRLAAVLVKPVSTWQLVALAFQGALGRLGDDERLRSFGFRRMTVSPQGRAHRKPLKVATDGEVGLMRPPLVFAIAPQRLPLLVPAEAVATP